FNFFLNADNATLNTTSYNSATTGDRENVFDWHQERLVDSTLWLRDVAVQSLNQLLDGSGAHLVVVLTVQSHQRRTDDDRSVVAWEIVSAEQVTHFHFDQFQQLGVVHHVSLVQEDNDVGNTNLTGQQDVLASLRHRAVSSRANQNRPVHLRSTGDHVLHIVSVAWAVNVCVVTDRGIIFNVGGVDGDTTSLLFRRVVDLREVTRRAAPGFRTDLGQCSGERGFAMV